MTVVIGRFPGVTVDSETAAKATLRHWAGAVRANLADAPTRQAPGHAEYTHPEQDYPALTSLFERGAFQQHFQPDSTILLHGERAGALYRIVSGTVRCCMINEQGARQIPGFSSKNGFLGIADRKRWHFTAEAVDHVIINSVPRAVVERAMATDPALREEMCAYMSNLLECREKQLLTMVSAKASDRVYQFLCDFASSRTCADYVALPMCRRDIADHLGLSVETVSRAFSDLKRKGRIDLASCEKYRITALAG